jgi:hypothetical protein
MGTNVITGANPSDLSEMQDVNVRLNSLQVISGGYQDLGLVIDATNMAAGATVYSNWYDNVEWVRNSIVLVQTDQQYDLLSQIRDSQGNIDGNGSSIAATQSANTTNFRKHISTGANSIFGYSVKYGLKNSSASPNTYGRARVQLMGL